MSVSTKELNEIANGFRNARIVLTAATKSHAALGPKLAGVAIAAMKVADGLANCNPKFDRKRFMDAVLAPITEDIKADCPVAVADPVPKAEVRFASKKAKAALEGALGRKIN